MRDFGLRELIGDARDYVFGDGNVPFIPYQTDSDFTKSFVKFENQSIPNFETYACTCFASTTQIEIQEKRQYGIEKNYSDRWLAIISGLNGSGGTDPQRVYQAIRDYGLIPEDMLPFSGDINTAEEYFSFKGANREECYAEGRRWLEKYDFRYEKLWKGERPENFLEIIKKAQQSCCPTLSVSAWNEVNGEYVSTGNVNNHLTLGVRFIDEKEQVFDTYKRGDTNLKILAKDHNIRRGYRIFIQKKTKQAMRKDVSTLIKVLNFLKELVKKNLL